MMKLVITTPARESLKQIHDYYKENVSLKVAQKIKTGIIQKLEYLSQHPMAGQEEELLKGLDLGHRRLVEQNYKIIYRVVVDTIYVTDIFDSRRDPSQVKP